MRTVGDQSRFAVEYGLDANHGGDWLYGKVCFWIDSARVGDFELGTSLRDFLFSIERLRCERGRRNNARFASKSAQEIYELLDGSLFGAGNPNYDEIANEEQWARHLLMPEVDVFDRCKIFLIEANDCARLIYRCGAPGPVREQILRLGECDDVLDEACKQIGGQLRGQDR